MPRAARLRETCWVQSALPRGARPGPRAAARCRLPGGLLHRQPGANFLLPSPLLLLLLLLPRPPLVLPNRHYNSEEEQIGGEGHQPALRKSVPCVAVIRLSRELPPSRTLAWRRSRRIRACSWALSGDGAAFGVSSIGIVVTVKRKWRDGDGVCCLSRWLQNTSQLSGLGFCSRCSHALHHLHITLRGTVGPFARPR